MKDDEYPITTIDELSDFAKNTNRKIFYSEVEYPGASIRRVTLHKRTFYIPNNSNENVFLIGYSDPKQLQGDDIFFGVFFLINAPLSKKMLIRKKNVIDKLNPFAAKNKIKSNSHYFNDAVVISANDNSMVSQYVNNSKIQKIILETLNFSEAMYAGINECNIDFVPKFKSKSHFGIFSKLKWMTEEKLIERLFEKAENLRIYY